MALPAIAALMAALAESSAIAVPLIAGAATAAAPAALGALSAAGSAAAPAALGAAGALAPEVIGASAGLAAQPVGTALAAEGVGGFAAGAPAAPSVTSPAEAQAAMNALGAGEAVPEGLAAQAAAGAPESGLGNWVEGLKSQFTDMGSPDAEVRQASQEEFLGKLQSLGTAFADPMQIQPLGSPYGGGPTGGGTGQPQQNLFDLMMMISANQGGRRF